MIYTYVKNWLSGSGSCTYCTSRAGPCLLLRDFGDVGASCTFSNKLYLQQEQQQLVLPEAPSWAAPRQGLQGPLTPARQCRMPCWVVFLWPSASVVRPVLVIYFRNKLDISRALLMDVNSFRTCEILELLWLWPLELNSRTRSVYWHVLGSSLYGEFGFIEQPTFFWFRVLTREQGERVIDCSTGRYSLDEIFICQYFCFLNGQKLLDGE